MPPRQLKLFEQSQAKTIEAVKHSVADALRMPEEPAVYFVDGPHGWVEKDGNIADGTLPRLAGRWRHPDPQHWHNVRSRATVRDRGRCVTCNSDRHVDCHHRTYVRWGCERLEDVYLLCAACHGTFHRERRLAG